MRISYIVILLLIGHSQLSARAERQTRKRWTILIYMAADNDLYPFADRNLEQMKQIGSNENVNILVHLDMHKPGAKKVTRRLFIQKNKAIQIGPDRVMDSGSEETLIDALKWAEDEFPSEYLAIDFWNHGSGDLNPTIGRTINPSQLFVYNPETKLIELDRTIGFLDFIDSMIKEHKEDCRGVCFDETTGNYLNDQKLKHGLEVACAYRGNRKIDVIIFDACLMAGTGTTWIMQSFADYMAASEEVVLGTGYEYDQLILPLTKNTTTPEEFAKHIVECYAKTYGKVTNDYTQSAIKLSEYAPLAENIDLLARLLISALQKQKNNSVKEALKQSRNKLSCTHFDEPSYIDLRHFYKNLYKACDTMSCINTADNQLITAIKQTLLAGLTILNRVVIANAAGQNLREAGGMSIYFPERKMHPSFTSTEFGQHNHWAQFLTYYLSLKQ